MKKMKKRRVVCAMSGGVDSSVAAVLLKKQGYEVIGVFMKLWAENTDRTDLVRENICCSHEAAMAARAVAAKLNIPFYVVNLQKEFKKAVVDYYIEEHESGRTPNPCVICNRDIKGEVLMRKALELKADYLATGHYARIEQCHSEPFDKTQDKLREESLANASISNKLRDSSPSAQNDTEKYYLLQAVDKQKDQTYFLWMLKQKHLSKLLFPVGGYLKSDVRKMAKKWGLPTAQRKESQGVCFIPDRDIGGFLRRHTRKLTQPGEMRDMTGKILGQHHGLIGYTIGQREHLGLGGPKTYYVVELNSASNTLIVGSAKDLYQKTLMTEDLNWISGLPPVGVRIGARIRYGHPIEECQLEIISQNRAKVTFARSQRAITPGQSIVFYDDEKVLGGGVIG